MHFDMFCSGVKHGVAREIYTAHIVAEDADRIRDGNAQVLQKSLEPYSFTSGDCRAPIFGFCARQGDCRLLLVAPSDNSIVEGEGEPLGRWSACLIASLVCISVPFESNDRVQLIHDVVIHHPTNVFEYSLSAIQMNIPRFLHELAK